LGCLVAFLLLDANFQAPDFSVLPRNSFSTISRIGWPEVAIAGGLISSTPMAITE
jgi:hypothetical protein